MKKILTTLLLLLVFGFISAQKVDTIIKVKFNGQLIYTSYFCKAYKVPLYVSYKLYNCPQGSEVSRKGLTFKNDIKGLKTATPKDYSGSKYDEGHMADAADFSTKSDSGEREKLTFRFYNALPQTHNLNGGIWKSLETTVRKESATDSLLVICGGIFKTNTTLNNIPNGVVIPTYCWKVVKDLKTGKYIHISVFTNLQEGSTEQKLNTIDELKKMILSGPTGYKIDLF